MPAIFTSLPADVADIIQQGFLDKTFLEALKPKVLFRSEATREEIQAEAGTSITKTRDGLPVPRVVATTPGNPTPEMTYSKEQWTVTPAWWTSKKTTRLQNAAVTAVNLFLRDARKLAEHAGLSIDRVARNRLFAAYCGGDTLSVASAASGQATMKVASLSGFRFAQNANGVLGAVSASNAVSVTVTDGTNTETKSVVSAVPDDADFPDGPGLLTFSANLASTFAARTRCFAATRPYIARPASGSIDAMTSGSVLTYDMLLAARRVLKENNVPTFSDGTYHMHIDPVHVEHMLKDTSLKQFLQGQPDNQAVQLGVISRLAGVTFMDNNDCPKISSVQGGTLNMVGSALQSKEIAAEVANNTGVPIRRSILLGADALIEAFVPWQRAKSASQGREGSFGYDGGFIDNSGAYNAMLEGIHLHIRPPLDEHGYEITQAYDLTADWVPPLDGTATSSSALYKRAAVFETAGPA